MENYLLPKLATVNKAACSVALACDSR